MKTKFLFCVIVCITMLNACDDKGSQYIDLNTGKRVDLVKDSVSGIMVNVETREPVTIYYDTKTKDTIWGKTGIVINNKVIKTDDGKYTYDDGDYKEKSDDGDTKIKIGDDYKMKVEKDGDIKIKDGDTKTKIGEDGEKKVKKDD